MKIIKQSHQFIHEPDPMKLIEACGRTCYKSENKITENSAEKFVQMITKAGHYSVLEHANICFEINCEYSWKFMVGYDKNRYLNCTAFEGRKLISGNFRAWLEFQRYFSIHTPSAILDIFNYLSKNFPAVFTEYYFDPILSKSVILVTEDQMTPEEKLIHATRTCRFITNRAITHEMVRHRNFSYSQESTRYVKYDGNMEFILPVWLDDIWLGDWFDRESAWQSRFGRRDEDWMQAPALWLWSCEEAETHYKTLITQHAWRPEQARGVLPNDLKTEIVCTASLSEWKHMLGLRTSKAAHPQIRSLMTPALEELQKELPEIFKE